MQKFETLRQRQPLWCLNNGIKKRKEKEEEKKLFLICAKLRRSSD
jgi:hypothetical protein